jgi:alanine-synthesizing transaminase
MKGLAMHRLLPSRHLADVSYEIRGPLARRAEELERQGYEIIKLNIGNPATFGFRTPETMRLAIIENLRESEGYGHQKGIFPAREAVAVDTQLKGIRGVSADHVFMGNGVSELILLTMEALLDPGDEVLLPAPDYPLWSAAVALASAKAVYYDCAPQNAFCPDPDQIASLITSRTKAIVIINPNNPTGAVYPREVLERIVRIAEERRLVVFSDEIYDRILYDGAAHVPLATLCEDTLCATFGGLSKVYRACGFRCGWVFFSGKKEHAGDYIQALELLASLRLCANIPGQWAVQTALGGVQSIYELTSPSGRLGRQRRAAIESIQKSKYLELVPPRGALYGFVGVRKDALPTFDDRTFAMQLLEEQRVLVVPGSSFHVDYHSHFRITFLPYEETMWSVFGRIEKLLDDWAAGRLALD